MFDDRDIKYDNHRLNMAIVIGVLIVFALVVAAADKIASWL